MIHLYKPFEFTCLIKIIFMEAKMLFPAIVFYAENKITLKEYSIQSFFFLIPLFHNLISAAEVRAALRETTLHFFIILNTEFHIYCNIQELLGVPVKYKAFQN